MQIFNSSLYIEQLEQHYKSYFTVEGRRLILDKGPKEKLRANFFVFEVPPNKRHNMFTYCTVGISADRMDENLIELFVFSPKQSSQLVELMTICASYRRNTLPLNIHHTVNIGQPWLDNSIYDHGFISLPYLNGPELEFFNFEDQKIHCYWFIPITEIERDYKVENGCEALEQLFENKQLDYLNPSRKCLVKE